MSTEPEAPAGGANAPMSSTRQMMKSCWSCRVISGGGLFLSGLYVCSAARRMIRPGIPASLGTMLQITFGAGLAAWGIVVILSDPAGKAEKKT